jgi:hypothetical protein
MFESDEEKRVEFLSRITDEAYALAIRLGVSEAADGGSESDLYALEKLYRIRLMAVRRLIRRWNTSTEAEIEFRKTDVQKTCEARHAQMTEMFMRERGMSRLDAAVAASGVMYEEVFSKENDDGLTN